MKKILFILKALVIVSLIIGCSHAYLSLNANKKGDLSFFIAWPEKQNLSVKVIPEKTAKISITLSGDTLKENISKTVFNPQQSILITGIPIGKVSILIQAFDSSNIELANAKSEAVIRSNYRTRVEVSLATVTPVNLNTPVPVSSIAPTSASSEPSTQPSAPTSPEPTGSSLLIPEESASPLESASPVKKIRTLLITVDQNPANVGQKVQLHATFIYEDGTTEDNVEEKVDWKSSNKIVAEINNYGSASCYNSGSTTITATAKDYPDILPVEKNLEVMQRMDDPPNFIPYISITITVDDSDPAIGAELTPP